MYISERFRLPKGHGNFDFVDINLKRDTELFIDPCLIKVGISQFCKNSIVTIQDYFDNFYNLYRNHATNAKKGILFQYAHEINATKLGYGSGNNGKAKTSNGMIDTFAPLQALADSKVPLSEAIDLSIFIDNFAEDCLSDILTNILFLELSQYTIEQCKKYFIPLSEMPKKYHFWDIQTHSWKLYEGLGLIICGSPIILVPKQIVHHNFYYNTDQYFRHIILERKQKEQTIYDNNGREFKPSKKSLRKILLKSHHDILEISRNYTKSHPNLLDLYHKELNLAYSSRKMTDEELDDIVY